MEKQEVGFIRPDKMCIMMPYYKVEDYCIKEIDKFLKKNPSEKQNYINFCKKYTYFHPYFDYVIFEMEYIFLNPLEIHSFFGAKGGKNSTLDMTNITEGSFICGQRMDDETLKGEMVNDYFDSSIIMSNSGTAFIKERYLTHMGLLNHILNQILIQSKEIYLDYQKYRTQGMYLINRLGFIWYGYYGESDILLLYNSNLISDQQRLFYLSLREYYPSDRFYISYQTDLQEKIESKELILLYNESFESKNK